MQIEWSLQQGPSLLLGTGGTIWKGRRIQQVSQGRPGQAHAWACYIQIWIYCINLSVPQSVKSYSWGTRVTVNNDICHWQRSTRKDFWTPGDYIGLVLLFTGKRGKLVPDMEEFLWSSQPGLGVPMRNASVFTEHWTRPFHDLYESWKKNKSPVTSRLKTDKKFTLPTPPGGLTPPTPMSNSCCFTYLSSSLGLVSPASRWDLWRCSLNYPPHHFLTVFKSERRTTS